MMLGPLVSVTLLSIALASSLLRPASGSFTGFPEKNNHQNDGPAPTANRPSDLPSPSEKFPFHEILDENYELFWDFNDTHIVFETIVKTNGYVGFGISANGAMAPSDVVIGWVKNGRAHFSDRHADGHYLPAVDNRQDWHLISGSESGQYTILKMVRRLDTCDTQDKPILEGTTRVIYSYHPSDPISDSNVPYHGADRRGSKSLLLRDPPSSVTDQSALPDDVITFDFLNGNYSVPALDTTYRCTMWKMPDLGGKHHLIRYAPVIQKGHEKLLHHIILYYCAGSIDTSVVGTTFSCYRHEPNAVHNCNHVFVAWAIGGEVFNYPMHVGHSLGTSQDPGYFKMETHYDNPDMRSDFVDNSGLKLYLTKQLRQYDAGVLEAGVAVNEHQIIPPYETNFLSSGHCHQSCLSQVLGDQEIRVFSNLLHAHLIGVKLRTRHFRNGIELPPIGEDNSYDFNFQEQRKLKEERVIKKGDSLLTECVYDSTQRTGITYGGLSSREEMCLSFLVYYPRVPLSKCLSVIDYKIPHQFAGQSVFQIVRSLDFSDPAIRAAFTKDIQESQIVNVCRADNIHVSFNGRVTPIPTIRKEYVHNATCHN